MRFYGLVFMAFVTAFVGFSWASRGFPVAYPSLAMKANPEMPTFGGESARKFEQQAWIESKTNESDKDPERDRLRMDALQAANAYSLSPCDQTIKANFVKALSAYAEAYQNKLDCPVLMFCSDKKRDAATAAFSTPLDKRVSDAVHEAFDKGGISRNDFPEKIRFSMLVVTRGPTSDDPDACLIPNRAEGRPR